MRKGCGIPPFSAMDFFHSTGYSISRMRFIVSQSTLTSFFVSLLFLATASKKFARGSSVGATGGILWGLGEAPVGVKALAPGVNLNSFALTFRRALLAAVGLSVSPSRAETGPLGMRRSAGNG